MSILSETKTNFSGLMGVVREELDKDNAKRLTGDLYAKALTTTINHAVTSAKDMAMNGSLIEDRKNLVKEQVKEVTAKITYVEAQKAQLVQSVIDNKHIHAAEGLSEMMSYMYSNDYTPSVAMQTFMLGIYSNMAKDIPGLSVPITTIGTKV
ncbi:hypothetical protein [Sulfurimonas sp.]|uniref:hypothetical protein n=1 Tax=Sulfurimonas sp. TaxID=2022749 RepID=UPI0025FC1531|nr:hypothetical protein [Sulfurimonas sp.]